MNYDYEQTEFSKSVLSGLFAGIFATFANLIYNFIFRDITQFNPSSIVNVSSIIIISVLLVTIAGVIFYLFHHYIKGGNLLFRAFFLVLTAISVYYAMQVQRSNDATVSKQFQELLAGVIIILGAFIVFYIPYLFDHETVYS
jgi:hypothetical protein